MHEYSAPCGRCIQDLGNAAGETCVLLSAEQRRAKRGSLLFDTNLIAEKSAGIDAAASSLLGLRDIGSQSSHAVEGPGEEQRYQTFGKV